MELFRISDLTEVEEVIIGESVGIVLGSGVVII